MGWVLTGAEGTTRTFLRREGRGDEQRARTDTESSEDHGPPVKSGQ